MCLISLESQLLADRAGGDKESESQETKEAPKGLGTSERSWEPLMMSADLSQGPRGL